MTEFELNTMDSATPPVFKMTGQIRTKPFRFAGTVGSWDELSAPSDPYPVKLEGELGHVAMAVEGTSLEPLRLRDTRVRFRVDGKSLSELGELIGLRLPQTPDFHAGGDLVHDQGDWSMDGFDARLGSSKFSGSATLELSEPTPTLKMHVTASQLNLADFRSLLVRMFSDIRLPPELLSEANADISFSAERISGIVGLPVEQMTARALLEHGALQLARAQIGIAKGEITAQAKYIPSQGAPTLYVEFEIQGVDLHRLAVSQTAPDLAKAMSGNLEGSLQIRTTGATPHELLRHMSGEIGAFIEGGSVSALATASLELDLLRMIGLAGSPEQAIRLNCLVSHLVIRDGVAVMSPVVLDTDDLTAVVSGSVNLGAETLALRFVPKSKGYRPLTVAKSFSLDGSVWKPAIRSDSDPVSDLGSAIVSLIPSVHDQPASAAHPRDGAVCGQANAEARRSTPKSAAPSRDAEYKSGLH